LKSFRLELCRAAKGFGGIHADEESQLAGCGWLLPWLDQDPISAT
jgi:hypothetical protein